MNQLGLQTAKVVTALTDKGWSQIHTFGQLLAVVTLSQVEDQQAALGKEAITRLHEEYFGAQTTESPLLKLKRAVTTVAAEVGGNLGVVAMVLVGQALYLVVLGGGRVVLRRSGKTAILLTGGDQVVTASGFVHPRDCLLLGNGDFFHLVDGKSISRALASESVAEAAEILAPLTHESNGSSLAAAAVARIEPQVLLPQESPTVTKPKAAFRVKELLTRLRRKILPVNWRVFYLRLQARHKQKSRQTLFTVALGLLFLLGVSVFFGQQKLQKRQTAETTTNLLQQAQTNLEAGEVLVTLNQAKAKEVLLQAQDDLNQAKVQGETGEQWVALTTRLAQILPQVVREHEVQLELFFDLVLIKEGAVATDAVLADGRQLVVLDAGKQAVYQLDLASRKQALAASGNDLAEASQVAALGEQIFVATGKEIFKITAAKKVASVAKIAVGIKDLQSFGTNLYLLTGEGIEVLPADAAGGLGEPRSWLQEASPLSQPVAMAIDGSIWVLQTGGQILKFTRGQKEIFGVAGLDKPLAEPKAIFTDESQDNLYILDQNNSRIVVLEKSGEYHGQYLGEGLKDATGLVVSEEDGRIFVLSQNKIYSIGIE